MSDLKFRLAVKLEGGNPVLPGEPALPPTLTARWDGLAPGTYRVFVYPLEGQPRPSSPQTFSVSGTISYP